MADRKYYEVIEHDLSAEARKQIRDAYAAVKDAHNAISTHVTEIKRERVTAKEHLDQIQRSGEEKIRELDQRIENDQDEVKKQAGQVVKLTKENPEKASVEALASYLVSNLASREAQSTQNKNFLQKITTTITGLNKQTGQVSLNIQNQYSEHFDRIESYASSLEFCFSEISKVRADPDLDDEDRDEKEGYWRRMLEREIDLISSG